MVVKSNMQAMNSNRMLGIVNVSKSKSTEKLSSGYKVNRAADDAAGLAISEKMRRQIKGLTQASANAQDGISFCQIADGALNEIHDMLKRSETLAVQAANGTNSDEDRAKIQDEINQLSTEIDRVHTTSVFNEIPVFSEFGAVPLGKEANGNTKKIMVGDVPIEIELGFLDSTGTKIDPTEVKETGNVNSTSDSNSDMAQFVVKAAADAVYNLQQNYPGLFSAASSNGIKIGLNMANIDGKGNTLASAALSMQGNSESTVMSYSMNVDTSDYSKVGFSSMTAAQKADLAATVAHEMTHLVMYDTVTDGMIGGSGKYPKWFVEGMAQTSSGDGGWLSNRIGPASSDAQIKNYMSQLDTMPYGAGYLATMSLGLAASGNPTDASAANIKKGLNKILTDLGNKKSLDQAIAGNTSYAGLNDFQNKFKSGETGTTDLAKAIVNKIGSSGAGSLFGELSDPQSSVFAPASLTSNGGNYEIDPTNTWFSNAFGSGYEFPTNLLDGGGIGFQLQVGSEAGQLLTVKQFNVSSSALFDGAGMDVTTQDNAGNTIDMIKKADARIAHVRSYYGATQNRLEHTIKNLDNVIENTTAAESEIRDTDMAEEMVRFSNSNILSQAGTSMLAQANQSNQNILSLLS